MRMVLGIVLLSISTFINTSVVNSYRTEIDNGMVEVEPIIQYFNGIDNVNRDEGGWYYRELVFNNHIVHSYSDESVLRLNGEIVPYTLVEVDGIYLPQSNTDVEVSILDDFVLPARFFEHYLDYTIDDGYLVYGDAPVDPVVPQPTKPVIDTPNNEPVEIPVQDEEETPAVDTPAVDTPDEEKPVEETPTAETPKESDVPEDTDNDDTDTEPVDDTPVEEEETPKEREPQELGRVEINIDRADAEKHSNADDAYVATVNGQTFQLIFVEDHFIRVRHVDTDKTIGADVDDTTKRTVPFNQENGDYYIVVVNISDTRDTLSEDLEEIHEDISLNDSTITLSLNDEQVLTRTFDETLSYLEKSNHTVTDKEILDSKWVISIR